MGRRAAKYALCAAIPYALGAFVLWDMNPGNWNVFARLLVAFTAAWAAVFTVNKEQPGGFNAVETLKAASDALRAEAATIRAAKGETT